jgi:hypothetical protein
MFLASFLSSFSSSFTYPGDFPVYFYGFLRKLEADIGLLAGEALQLWMVDWDVAHDNAGRIGIALLSSGSVEGA